MDLRQLKHFCGVAAAGTFTRAANDLHISQPALSRSVKILEDALDVVLFDRHGRGLVITQAGELVLRYASQIINSMDTLKREIGTLRAGGLGEARIGVPPLLTDSPIERAITRAVLANERLQVDIVVGLYEELVDLLRGGKLDFLISAEPQMDTAADLRFMELMPIQSVLVTTPDSPFAKRDIVEVKELQDANWVILNNPHNEAFMTSFFARKGLEAPRRRIRTTSLNTLRSFLRQGGFVGLLPAHWVESDLAENRLALIRVEGMPVVRQVGIVTRTSAPASPTAAFLIEQIIRCASDG